MRRFAASVFAPRRDKAPPSVASDASLATASDDHLSLHKKSWKSWFKAPAHKLALSVDYSSPYETDSDDVHLPSADLARLVANSLLPPLTQPPSPFAHPSNAPFIFPRSCNPPDSSPPRQTLRTITLKRRLHRRLLVDPHRLHPQNPPLVSPAPTSDLMDIAPSSAAVISLVSPGLTRWISRPCFEDRYAVYVPAPDGSVSPRPVAASSLAIAELEYSEALEAMVEQDYESEHIPSPLLITTPPTPTPDFPPSPPPDLCLIPAQSLLENRRNQSPSFAITPLKSAPPPAPPIVASGLPPKRGVHFAEDDEKDDVIPLGYVLRQKQKRQEKAKFLKSEADRRALEEERLKQQAEKQQAERRRREAEIVERATEYKALESEKRLIEDKKKRMYAEQVAAARTRREFARAGGVPSSRSSNNDQPGGLFPASASSLTLERNKPPPTRRHSRQDEPTFPPVPPRREASEPTLIPITRADPPAPPSSYHDSSNSPSSSRPPSLGTPPTPSSLAAPPTPGSGCLPHDLASPEDVRAAMAAAMSRSKKRISFGTQNGSTTSLAGDRLATYPIWTGSNHSLNSMVVPLPVMPIPPMMPMGYVMMDMPLLPPTPPFMMQQYARHSGSQGSGSGSSRGNLSRQSSTERVGGRRGSQSNHGHNHPRSASFPDQLAPQHHPSSSFKSHLSSQQIAESRRASMPVTPQHRGKAKQTTSQQRPQHTQHLSYQSSRPQPSQQQSPWTGLPTQSGKLPSGLSPSKPAQSSLRSSSARKHLVP